MHDNDKINLQHSSYYLKPMNKHIALSLVFGLVFFVTTFLIIEDYIQKYINQEFERMSIISIVVDDNTLKFWLSLVGHRKIISKFNNDPLIVRSHNCHELNHKIGKLIYQAKGNEVFSIDNFGCGLGLLHGAIKEAVVKKGLKKLTTDIENICQNLKTPLKQANCYHAIGHGLMSIYKYDLISSLEKCQDLESDKAKRRCSGGVFMESVMLLISGSGNGNHPGVIHNSNLYYPCSQVANYDLVTQQSCYEYQASRVLELNSKNFYDTVAFCKEAQESLRESCFRNIGQEAVFYHLDDSFEIVKICQIDKDYTNVCIHGAIYSVFNTLSNLVKNEPHKICNQLMGEQKNRCYKLLGKNVGDFFEDDLQKITEICNLSEEDFHSKCMEAATFR